MPVPQEYTITDPAFDYDLTPQFSVDPAICATTLEIKDPTDPTTTYPGTTLDDGDQTLNFPPITDSVDPSDDGDTDGENEVDVETCYNVFDYSGAITETVCVETPVTIKNPCLDQNYVTISCPALDALSHTVATGLDEYDAHSLCTVETTPIVGHDLCGNLVYTPTYDNAPITDTTVMGYDPATNQFDAETDDPNLIGEQKPYGIKATFENYPEGNYPSVSTDSADSTIDFLGPCGTDATITAENWAPFSDEYTNTKVSTAATSFTVTPDFCLVSYSCLSVVRVDGVAAPTVDCSDFTLTPDVEIFTQVADTEYQNGNFPPGEYKITI